MAAVISRPNSATISGSTASEGSHAISYPTVAAGDLILLWVTTISTTPTITDPSGWTVLDTQDGGTTSRTKVYYKISDGTESGSVTISVTGGTTKMELAMLALRGVDIEHPIDSHIAASTSTGTSHSPGSLTPSSIDVWNIVWCQDRQSTSAQTFTAPGGYTRLVQDSSASATPWGGLTVCSSEGVISGATNPAVTCTNSSSTSVTGQIMVKRAKCSFPV